MARPSLYLHCRCGCGTVVARLAWDGRQWGYEVYARHRGPHQRVVNFLPLCPISAILAMRPSPPGAQASSCDEARLCPLQTRPDPQA